MSAVPTGLAFILSNNPGTEVPGYFSSVPDGTPERCPFDIRPVSLTLGAPQVDLMLKGRHSLLVSPFQGSDFIPFCYPGFLEPAFACSSTLGRSVPRLRRSNCCETKVKRAKGPIYISLGQRLVAKSKYERAKGPIYISLGQRPRNESKL
jgi:hypothetical protein